MVWFDLTNPLSDPQQAFAHCTVFCRPAGMNIVGHNILAHFYCEKAIISRYTIVSIV